MTDDKDMNLVRAVLLLMDELGCEDWGAVLDFLEKGGAPKVKIESLRARLIVLAAR